MSPGRRPGTGLALAVALLLGACAPMNPYYNPSRPHHTPSGFRNNYSTAVDKPLADLLRWRWEAMRQGLPRPPQVPTATVAPDLPFLKSNAATGHAMRPAITWIGHATMLVQASGLNVLTDPVFSERASPVQFAGPKRAQPPGVAMADLPAIDVVVISHNHYDHLDRDSVLALNRRAGGGTLFLVPLGLKPWMAALGVTHVVELDWWQHHTHQGVDFHFTPVQHWSARSFNDRLQTLWGGWSVFGPDFHWYFSGDTGYSQDFNDTRRHFEPRQPDGFDLALLAVGAYEPRWFMKEQHINPAEAVQIHKDLGARRSVGVHWGTFNLTDEPLDQPPRDLAVARRDQGVPDDDFFLLKIGETRQLPPRADRSR
ncbi:MAG: MBL fold metallo-hydrolase [Ramlibacter sp.]|nr:MBL fold metallo-hydrolase [Ramlibacter sp.]